MDGGTDSDDNAYNLPVIRGPWFPVLQPDRIIQHVPSFNFNSGPVNVLANLSPSDFFMKFMIHEGTDVIQLITDETNRYASQCNAVDWQDVNYVEMKAFIGLYFAMGLLRKPTIPSYWESGVDGISDTPYFPKVMSRQRFQNIMNICTAPRPGMPNYDPLHKVNPIIDLLNGSFGSNFRLGQHVAIDERIVGFKGRHYLKQYISNKKRHRWGAKMWVLADSNTGYTHQVYIYKGRFTNNGVFPHGQGHHVVQTLMQPHLNKNHYLTTDRFFSSPKLFHDLFREGTYATGTVMPGRKGLPQSLKNLKLPKNEIAVRKQGPLIALLWSDRKQVMLLSTVGSPRMTNNRNTKGKLRRAPGIVHIYNNMGGVDLGDQMICVYDPDLRGRKLWRKILFNLLVTATVNSYILYKETFRNETKVTHLDFQTQLCRFDWGVQTRETNAA